MSDDCRHKLSLLASEWLSESTDVWRAVRRGAAVSPLMGIEAEAPDHSAWGPS